MSEYFTFLVDLTRTSTECMLILIRSGAIAKCSQFYLTSRRAPNSKQIANIKNEVNSKLSF